MMKKEAAGRFFGKYDLRTINLNAEAAALAPAPSRKPCETFLCGHCESGRHVALRLRPALARATQRRARLTGEQAGANQARRTPRTTSRFH